MAKKTLKITAGKISSLLAKRHEKDLYVPECKNGPSYGRKLRILDAWVLRKTWSPMSTIGYEIKVDRHDFEQDQKWVEYLDYVHEFYFVCPPGLIKAHELPKGIGLIWTTMNGERLQTKTKAAHSTPDQEKLINLVTYVLMARSVVVGDMYAANAGILPGNGDRLQEMKELIQKADERKEMALIVNRHTRERFQEMGEEVREAQRSLEKARRFAERLAKLGIIWDPKNQSWTEDRNVEDAIDLLKKRITPDMLRQMESYSRVMQETTTGLRASMDALQVDEKVFLKK